MGTMNRLENRTVFFDSAPLVYYVEGVTRYLSVLDPIFEMIEKGAIRSVSSTITLVEVLVAPIRRDQTDL